MKKSTEKLLKGLLALCIVIIIILAFVGFGFARKADKLKVYSDRDIDLLVINKALALVTDMSNSSRLWSPSEYDPTLSRFMFDGISLNTIFEIGSKEIVLQDVSSAYTEFKNKLNKGKILQVCGAGVDAVGMGQATIVNPDYVRLGDPVRLNPKCSIIFHQSFNEIIARRLIYFNQRVHQEKRAIGLTTGALPNIKKTHDVYHREQQRQQLQHSRLDRMDIGVARLSRS